MTGLLSAGLFSMQTPFPRTERDTQSGELKMHRTTRYGIDPTLSTRCLTSAVLAIALSSSWLLLPTDASSQPAPASKPSAVWEIWYGKTIERVELLADGTTSNGKPWELRGRAISFDGATGELSRDGLSAEGRAPGGGYWTGRLLSRNMKLQSKPVGKEQPDLQDDGNEQKESVTVGVFQLVGLTQGGSRHMNLSVHLTEQGQVLDGDQLLATWTYENRKLSLHFADERLGVVVLGIRNPSLFSGRHRAADRENWTMTLTRIERAAVIRTEAVGDIVFYSNGRVDGPLPDDSEGHWWLEGTTLKFRNYGVTLRPGMRQLTGRGPGGAGFAGQLISGSFQ